ncbi:hypothetical protein [Flindersiella endophytica]
MASLVVAILTLLIALPGAINDWTTLRGPQPTPTDTVSATTSGSPTSPTTRPSSPAPSKTAKPGQDKDSSDTSSFGVLAIVQRVNTFRSNLSTWSLVSVVAAGAVVIFVCAGICRMVIITSYWPIGIPTWAILIAIPFFVWPSVSDNGTTMLTVLGVVYAVTGIVIVWLATAIADP